MPPAHPAAFHLRLCGGIVRRRGRALPRPPARPLIFSHSALHCPHKTTPLPRRLSDGACTGLCRPVSCEDRALRASQQRLDRICAATTRILAAADGGNNGEASTPAASFLRSLFAEAHFAPPNSSPARVPSAFWSETGALSSAYIFEA